jgi:hypothetical protein
MHEYNGWNDWANKDGGGERQLEELIEGITWLSLPRNEQHKTPAPEFTPLSDELTLAIQAAVRAHEMGLDVNNILWQQAFTERRLQTAADRKRHRVAELPSTAAWDVCPRPKELPGADLIVKLLKDDPTVKFSMRMTGYIFALLETYPSRPAKALLKALRPRTTSIKKRDLLMLQVHLKVKDRMESLGEPENVAVNTVAKQMSLTQHVVRKLLTERRRREGLRIYPFRKRSKRPSKN